MEMEVEMEMGGYAGEDWDPGSRLESKEYGRNKEGLKE